MHEHDTGIVPLFGSHAFVAAVGRAHVLDGSVQGLEIGTVTQPHEPRHQILKIGGSFVYVHTLQGVQPYSPPWRVVGDDGEFKNCPEAPPPPPSPGCVVDTCTNKLDDLAVGTHSKFVPHSIHILLTICMLVL